jgi:hypothetical protein
MFWILGGEKTAMEAKIPFQSKGRKTEENFCRKILKFVRL